MEIGSFIELDLNRKGEYFREKGLARLNSGRAGIVYALGLMNIQKIHIPFYQCPSVNTFLIANGIEVIPYFLDNDLEPNLNKNEPDSAMLLVNYYGLFDRYKLNRLQKKYTNVIIDNSQAFFTQALAGNFNVYSPRKFFGVPDGGYVIGPNANTLEYKLEQDFSSDTAGFLLKRIELGSSAVYPERQMNEQRIDHAGVRKMSLLTRSLLKAVDYKRIKKIRRRNFLYVHQLFKSINGLNINSIKSISSIPMVYPLLIGQEDLVAILKDHGVYTGRWWSHVLKSVDESTIEYKLSKYMIPVPIDQRYGEEDFNFIYSVIQKHLK